MPRQIAIVAASATQEPMRKPWRKLHGGRRLSFGFRAGNAQRRHRLRHRRAHSDARGLLFGAGASWAAGCDGDWSIGPERISLRTRQAAPSAGRALARVPPGRPAACEGPSSGRGRQNARNRAASSCVASIKAFNHITIGYSVAAVGSSNSRNRCRARCKRLMTVPIGTFITSAISL